MKVSELVSMLQLLPQDAIVWAAGQEGVFPCEKGNLFPMKVYRNERDKVGLYIDDGFCGSTPLIDDWMPLDEFVGANGWH